MLGTGGGQRGRSKGGTDSVGLTPMVPSIPQSCKHEVSSLFSSFIMLHSSVDVNCLDAVHSGNNEFIVDLPA